ncbi:MAG: LPS assembly lipoprotein LptE [Formosimonas sp.]
MFKRILITTSLLLLTACGFHLRGSQGAVALPFKTLSIVGDAQGAVAKNLSNRLRGQVTLTTPSQVVVELSKVEHTKSILTKDSQGRASEYRLLAQVTMQAYAANKDQLISPVTLNVTRSLTTGNGYDTGIDLEEARMYADMDSELANQVQYRLRAIKSVP